MLIITMINGKKYCLSLGKMNMAWVEHDTDVYTVVKTQVSKKRVGLDTDGVWLEQRSTQYDTGHIELEYFLCAKDNKGNRYKVKIHRI